MAIIQCPNCGNGISDKATICPKCGQVPTITSSELSQADVQAISKFNWGAFFLWPIWGFGNGMWWLFLISVVINFIPYGSIVQFPISIFMGFQGGELAWKNKNWRDINHFIEAQNTWRSCGLAMFFASLIILSVVVAIILTEY